MRYPEWWVDDYEFHVQRNDKPDDRNTKSWSRKPPSESGWHTVATYTTDGHQHSRAYDKAKKQAWDHMWKVRKQYSGTPTRWRVIVVHLKLNVDI